MTENLDGVVHHTAVVNGMKMHYVAAGSGPPVFLLHGLPEFWYAWRHQILALAERYTVVAPGLRGYGWASLPGAFALAWRAFRGCKRLYAPDHPWPDGRGRAIRRTREGTLRDVQ